MLRSDPGGAPRAKAPSLKQLFDNYLESLPNGALEPSTLALIRIHKKHLYELLGGGFTAENLKLDDLQRYVNKRSAKKSSRGTAISAITIRKELTTLSSVWSWALAREIVKHAFPNKGLRFPKTAEKPPFQTWAEIERQIKLGAGEELWQCLHLTLSEINEVLPFVKKNATQEFIYPMFVFAAHTGARRSEVLRSLKRDFDFESRTVLLREKKRAKGKRTFRRVPMTDLLVEAMQDWFSRHPGGPYTISPPLKTRTKVRDDFGPLSVDEATDYFWRTLRPSKWAKLRGWHVFRHSFASNCAAKGVDQRIIDEWMGHQTEEMRRRYRHLIPSVEKEAIASVFGQGTHAA